MLPVPPFILQRLRVYEGKSLAHLHRDLYGTLPLKMTKGFTGRLLEQLLEVTNLNESTPDFPEYGLEIKTIPIGSKGIVKEHTFLSTISLPFLEGTFRRSKLYHKIFKVLWIPILREGTYMSLHDQIGRSFIVELEESIIAKLEGDWNLLTGLLREEAYPLISSDIGEILHIRPKAQNAAHMVCVNGQRVNPMGFYFRKSYTQELIRPYWMRGLLGW